MLQLFTNTRITTVLLLFVSVFVGFSCCNYSSAIIIRDDVNDNEYRQNESDWPFVIPMDSSGKKRKGECAATLISNRYAITAAHCFGKKNKKFEIVIDESTYTVIEVYRNPCFNYKKDGPDGADVAIIKLDREPPQNIPRIPVYQERDEVNKRMELAGWGDTGKAGIKPNQVKSDRKFRVAQNIVTNAKKGMLFYVFDKNGLPLEGLAWSGDSGGPLFLTKDNTRYIAGVNSAGDCCKYGSKDGYSRLSVKYNWIQQTMENDQAANFDCKTLEDFPGDNGGDDDDGNNDNDDNNNDGDNDDECSDDKQWKFKGKNCVKISKMKKKKRKRFCNKRAQKNKKISMYCKKTCDKC